MVTRSPPSCIEAPLNRLHALERSYDGPVPAGLLAAIDAMPAELERRAAASDGAVIDRLAREAVRSAAAARFAAKSAAEVERRAGAPGLGRTRAAGLLLHTRRSGAC